MKHVSSGKEQTLTSAFRAKRRFLSLMMQEKFYFMIHFLIHVTEIRFDPFSVNSGVLLHHHDKKEALNPSGSKKTRLKN